MKSLFVILLSVIVVLADDDLAGEQHEVVAPIGRIRGSTTTSRLGKKIYSFRGVRYAEPPTGPQRFQVAIPAADWTDVFDATKEGPACPAIFEQNIMEDCLRVNVYTTKLPSKNDPVKRPVLVFFHPGGFYLHSGQSCNFGPQYLLDKDIVLVTVNYRLASLGFLSTGDSMAPGNLGLKDQVVALRWVQRNIAAFGGDPDSVTISGDSAGGLSVLLHMVSPMSKGLFHRAIMMSGSAMIEPFPTEQLHLAKKQAELLDCPIDTTGSMLICLNSKPVENFTDTISKFFEWYDDPILIWTPVVEPEIPGVERFLPEQPIDLIRKGKFHMVPLIAGVTKNEINGVVVSANEQHKLGNDSMLNDLNNDWYRLAPINFMYERDTPRSKHISTELRRFYFGDKPIGPETYDGLENIYSDSVIIYPVHRSVRLIAENSDQPVYFYMFSYQGRYSFGMWNTTTPYGVAHQDDLQYLFFMKSMKFPFFENNAPEIPMVDLITSMCSNFVQTGQPLSSALETKNITWEPYLSERDNYLEITEKPTMKTGLYPDRMQKWDSLFPLNSK
ncbi:PREDICTED: esterase FE4-like isoform X1 [Wasmannia auropunctata]|uniref:esterase FE4-like isoform X1 n=1 Tax=Wasmannia auropunctata TaxID=64793 RepID=UPI0005F0656D|nr:PREDICTED: esterase FE4-like isoform X1 [Wasmannia auropunctata]XP_011700536.1 PREDICTED: esterase FE4-like isoform X1 [Wasmannia auropunctata]